MKVKQKRFQRGIEKMPENDQYRHLTLRKLEIQQPRKKKKGSGGRPKRVNVDYSKELDVSIKHLQDEFMENIDQTPPEFDPAFIFRIKIEQGLIPDDEWRRSGLTLLSEEVGNYVVLFAPDQLEELKKRVDAYGQEIPDDKKNPIYGWIASLSTEMNLWGRNERIGRKLAEIDTNEERDYTIDVELWHYGSSEECQTRMQTLREFITNRNGQFLDFYVGKVLSIARVKITNEVLNQLLEVGIVERVDLPPQPGLSVGNLINTPLDDFDAPINAPADGAPGICIIDSGIVPGHPMLGPAIGDSTAVPAKLGSALDENGHGTHVAGIALYGDVLRCIDSLNFSPEFFLFSARVTNKDNFFDDERLLVKQMEEAIRYYFNEYGCRIFNISLADPKLVYVDGDKPSPWAQILDSLSSELDILVVVSAGNLVGIAGATGDQADLIVQNYPRYLLDDSSRILEPATGVNVLTVGGLAQLDFPRNAARLPNDPAIRCIAKIDEPSPFTRSGPGVNNSIKPDVCEHSGNLTWDGHTRRILNNDPDVGMVSTNNKYLDRLFTSDIGTSFAAPKVAHLAGHILKNYPTVSANLIRALIANSASMPEAVENILDKDDALKVCGYGKPDLNKALFSSENRVTLIAQDNIALDAIHVYQIPIPDEFKETDGSRSITISLAFDPPVRYTRKGYLGIKMDFYLLRGITTEQILDKFGTPTNPIAKENVIDALGSNKCAMFPSNQKRAGGTLQRGTWTAKRNQALLNYAGDVFHLVVISKTSSWISAVDFESQRYAVAVTLEHFGEPIDLYNIVQQRVRQEQRLRVR